MGGQRNAVHLITADGIDSWPLMPKTDVAGRLVARIAAHLERA
jgi:phosphopantothenoylcysteine decarboxylase/phosphopantothenate--cysteine ligase